MGLRLMAKAKKNKTSKFFIKHIIKIALFAWAIVILSYAINFRVHSVSDKSGDWGTFGDFVGGILNPMLSFLALIIVLKTYLSQQKELKETQKILKEQSETQKRQQFDSTFFALLQELKSLNESLKDISIKKDVHRDMSQLSNGLLLSGGRQNDLSDEIDEIRSNALRIFDKYPQFKILFQLLEFIAINSKNDITENLNSDDISKDNVSRSEMIYSNIIKALLPDKLMQLVAIAITFLCNEKNENKHYCKYKLLIERYAFFEYSSFKYEKDDDQLLEEGFEAVKNEQPAHMTDKIFEEVKNFYNPKAFGK